MNDTTKVLVVVDVQNDFITGSLANPEAQRKVPNIVKKIQEFDGDYIFLTRDTHDEDYLNTKEGEKLPFTHCVKNTDGWQIEDSVAEAIDAKVKEGNTAIAIIDKPTFGSYELVTSIGRVLGTNPASIELCGFCTDICVVSNALLLKAALYETTEFTVDASCCAGVTVETHKAALTTMTSCQINIIPEAE